MYLAVIRLMGQVIVILVVSALALGALGFALRAGQWVANGF
jgi:hypothetical protein